MRKLHAGSGCRHGDILEDVNVAQRGVVERREFLAAVYATGYVEPWVRSSDRGEVADEASILVEATIWG